MKPLLSPLFTLPLHTLERTDHRGHSHSLLVHQPIRHPADQQPHADVRIRKSFDTAIDSQLAVQVAGRAQSHLLGPCQDSNP